MFSIRRKNEGQCYIFEFHARTWSIWHQKPHFIYLYSHRLSEVLVYYACDFLKTQIILYAFVDAVKGL